MEAIEKWAPIIGEFSGLYEASDQGNIKSLYKVIKMPRGGERVQKEKKLSPGLSSNGYLNVLLCKNGISKSMRVNRLVWEAFNGPTDLEIDHIKEGNKLDNRLVNLQTKTSRENISKYFLTTLKTSRFTGVYLEKRTGKWISQIRINGKRKYLGSFFDEERASDAYKKALNLITT